MNRFNPVHFISDDMVHSTAEVEAKACDRYVKIERYGTEITVITVQRYGSKPQHLFLSEKAYIMLRDALTVIDDIEQDHAQNLSVVEEAFDGDFLKPYEQWR